MDKLDGVPLTDLAAIRSFTAARDPEEIFAYENHSRALCAHQNVTNDVLSAGC